jgi:hypothetical protein
MSATKILNEAQNLSSVSARLDSLADQYPAVSEALLVISVNLRDYAVLLELLVTSRMSADLELQ